MTMKSCFVKCLCYTNPSHGLCHLEKRLSAGPGEDLRKGQEEGILRQRIKTMLRFLYSLLLQQKLWETEEHPPPITHGGQSPGAKPQAALPQLGPSASHSRRTQSRQLPKLVQPMAPGPFLLPQLQSFPQTCPLSTTSQSNFHSHTGYFYHILRTTNPPASLPDTFI